MWTDFDDIIVYGDVDFYQILGTVTVFLAALDVLIYAFIIAMVSETHHKVGKRLKFKFIADAFLMATTLLMGMGAMFDLDRHFWEFAYISRVGILIMTPIVSIRLAFAFRDIIRGVKD